MEYFEFYLLYGLQEYLRTYQKNLFYLINLFFVSFILLTVMVKLFLLNLHHSFPLFCLTSYNILNHYFNLYFFKCSLIQIKNFLHLLKLIKFLYFFHHHYLFKYFLQLIINFLKV